LPEDRVGLQVGRPEDSVETILVALEVNDAVLAEAQHLGAQLLLTHHPLLYQPVSALRLDQPHARWLVAIVKADLALVTCHTNLDLAPGGLNDYLAQLLELEDIETFPSNTREPWFKLITFVPVGYEEKVRQALFDDRTGVIGAYSHCSFACRGQGTFLPHQGARPFRGELAKVSRVEESRLEIQVPASRLNIAVARLKAAHPYEEAVYDLYPLHNAANVLGFARVGRWSTPRPFPRIISQVKKLFGLPLVKVWGRPPEEVSRAAVAGGSAGDLVMAAQNQGAQILLTGEVRHHQVNIADFNNFAVLEIGHFQSEVVFMPEWAKQLEKLFQNLHLRVQIRLSEVQGVPVTYW